jgi:integrase
MGVKVNERDDGWYVFIYHRNNRKAAKAGQKRTAYKLAKELEAILQLRGWEGVLERLGESAGDTVKSFGQQWLDSPLNDHWADSTRESYSIAFKNYIVPALGKKRIGEVTRSDVINLIEGLVKAGYGTGWVNTVTVTLSGIFVRAMDTELVTVNPCRELGRYKRKGKKGAKPNPLIEEEARQMLEKAKNDPYPLTYAWILVALTSGLRPGEQAGLEWRDLDVEACTLKVERTFSKFKISKTKSGKTRTVDIPPQTVEVLKSQRTSLGAIPLPSPCLYSKISQVDA